MILTSLTKAVTLAASFVCGVFANTVKFDLSLPSASYLIYIMKI